MNDPEANLFAGGDTLARSLLDSLSARIALLDRHGDIVAVNDAWRRFALEVPAADGASVADLEIGANYPAACRAGPGRGQEKGLAAAEGVEAVLAGRAPRFTLEYRCHAPDRGFILDATPLAGGPAGALLAHWDITDRKRAEDTLRDSEMRYRGLVESAPDAILVFKENRVVLLNPACLRLFGAERPEDLLGGSPFDLLHPDCHALVLARIHKLLDEGMARPAIEEKIIRLDGGPVDVEVSAAPIDFEGGKAMHVVLRDITERKAREAELQHLIRTERAIGHINQALLHATDEAGFLDEVCRIVVEDCGHAMVWIGMAERDGSRGVRPVAHAGFEQGYLETLNLTWSDAEGGRGPTGAAIRTGQPSFCRDVAAEADSVHWRREAMKRGYASAAAFPLVDARGEALGAVTLYSRDRDPFTPEEARLLGALADDLAFGIRGLRLRAAHAETEAAMVALRNEFQRLLEWQVASQTAAAIAHEIGQPLNAVTTFGEAALLLLDNLSPRPEKLVRAVQGMAAQAERAGHVVRELMRFLRQAEVTVEDLELDALVRHAVAMARASFHGVGRISVIPMPGLKAVRGNRLQIEKVLMNLLGNGMDAMREAGLKGRDAGMTVCLAADGDMARVTVSDLGPGLDAAIAHRIFEPFFTTKAKGIGMGLAISRALVEAQGGRLWHEPAPGAGATFHFTVPFAP
jgi:PAS domain S-box-containing protein